MQNSYSIVLNATASSPADTISIRKMSLARLEQIVAKANEAGRPVSTAAAAFTLGFAAGKRFLQQKKLLRLQCRPQNYAWGRVGRNSKVARLMAADGLPVDESLPYAEYWFGTHAAAPSAVVLGKDRTQLLSEWLVQNPSALGRLQPVASRTGQLPFLFKVLSVAKALSIQAHPDKRLAENLHAARPDVYKDDNHKPEMAVALTQFEAMCGFRPLAQIAAHMTTEFPEFGTLIGSDRVTVSRIAANFGHERECLCSHARSVYPTLPRNMFALVQSSASAHVAASVSSCVLLFNVSFCRSSLPASSSLQTSSRQLSKLLSRLG